MVAPWEKPARITVICGRCNRNMLVAYDRYEQSYLNKIDMAAIYNYRHYVCPYCKQHVKVVER